MVRVETRGMSVVMTSSKEASEGLGVGKFVKTLFCGRRTSHERANSFEDNIKPSNIYVRN